ncbi:MAG TPA: fasciclin domain-containing protein [Blastococcus sp.]|nr:fasciclin domain-containing protein [Blastococcus sp.]
MKRILRHRGVLALAVAGLAAALTACGPDSPSASSTSSKTTAGASGSAAGTSAAADTPFGPGCATVPASGPGSFTDMAAAPVVTAASGNPALKSFVQALTTANLVDSLNTTPELTVLIPADPAFAAVPADQLKALMADVPRLTSTLLHHVIQGRLTPDRLAGTHTTLNNDAVTIAGSGTHFAVAGGGTVVGTAASVTCGDVRTSNATVYVIDQVLKPTGS